MPGKSKKKRGSVMDFFSPFGDTKPFGGFGSHMSGVLTFGKDKEYTDTYIKRENILKPFEGQSKIIVCVGMSPHLGSPMSSYYGASMPGKT